MNSAERQQRDNDIYQRRLDHHDSLDQLAQAFHLSRQRISQIVHTVAKQRNDSAYLSTGWIAIAAKNRTRARVETKCPVCGTLRIDRPAMAAARVACSTKCANYRRRKYGREMYDQLMSARASGDKWKEIGARFALKNPSGLLITLRRRLGLAEGNHGATHLSDEGRLPGAVSDHGDQPSEG